MLNCDDAIGKAIVEGYRRIPPNTPDEWGDLEHMADVTGHEAAQRLEEEERAAGIEPWWHRGQVWWHVP
jgi:hypothetical protein